MQRASSWPPILKTVPSLPLFATYILSNGALRTRGHAHNSSNAPLSGSAKLFADAAREDAEADAKPTTPTRIPFLENQHENWTGDESIQDAVLRMLVDKYKPLRTGTIQSAEQKLKQAPPRVQPLASQPISVASTPSTGSWATEPLLPSSESHRPWHTQFKAPSHATSSIKQAHFPSVASRPSRPTPVDDRARRKEREATKRAEHAGRLTRAKESTLDYRLGIRSTSPIGRPNPASVKGWTSLIEDKIEKARKAGLFKTVEGRGQPIIRNIEESNPFIAREEFLMNRIVQRNGAAPPWVDVQGELDTTVNTFREILRQSWIRRAVRVLTISTSPALLRTFSPGDAKAFRDPEWEQRERSYHEAALEEINSLVRKYNGLAPYSVRRPYYVWSAEVEKLYETCAEDICLELAERARGEVVALGDRRTVGRTGTNSGNAQIGDPWRLRDLFRAWMEKLIARLGLRR